MPTLAEQGQISIHIQGLSKVYGRERIVKDFSYQFEALSNTAVTGANGSGKSTLLKLLAGMVVADSGEISYKGTTQEIAPEHIYRQISYCAPAQSLIEEFTLKEMLAFHLKFRSLSQGMTPDELLKLAYFEGDINKKISMFSSGMKQRMKLALALFTDTPVLMLDEPTTNMDEHGCNWYKEQIIKMVNKRLIIIASNQLHEYEFCNNLIRLEDYKRH